MIPKIGSEVTVTVRNAMADFRHLYGSGVITEHVTFTGTVAPTERWQDAKRTLNLTTGIKSFPVRSIDMARVVSINGAKAKVIVAPKSRTWLVKGSKGNTYTVTEENGRRSCTCVGFGFRQQCKHLNMV